MGGRQRDAEECIGPEPGLVLGTVELDHAPVQGRLILNIHPGDGRLELAPNVTHCLEDPLAAITGLVPIPQLQGLPGAGGGTGGDYGAADGPIGAYHVGLDGGISAGIQDLTGADVDDLGHGASLQWADWDEGLILVAKKILDGLLGEAGGLHQPVDLDQGGQQVPHLA